MLLEDIWNNLTDAQATIVAALLTGIGFLLASIIGIATIPALVKRGSKELEKKTEQHINDLEEKFKEMKAEQESLRDEHAVLRADTAEAYQGPDSPPSTDAGGSQLAPEGAGPMPSNLSALWQAAKVKLEKMATNAPNGNTRSAYARIDRRNYLNLIEKLNQNGHLLPNKIEAWKKLVAIANKNKRGHYLPEEVEEFFKLADELDIKTS